jgi:thiol oxidase
MISDGMADNVEKKMEILGVMKSYVLNFFTCKECVKNFQKHAKPMEGNVKDVKDAVMYLWKAHNKVNLRLSKDVKTNDPLHPKVIFPPSELCTECRESESKKNDPDVIWNYGEVLKFLIDFYGKDNLVQDSVHQSSITAKNAQKIQVKSKSFILKNKKFLKGKLDREKRFSEQLFEMKNSQDRINMLRMHEQHTRHSEGRTRSVLNSWGLSSIDISLCVVFYIVCSVIILLLYFHFTVRRKYRCQYCQV